MVDLPLPEAPTRAVICPFSMSKLTPLSRQGCGHFIGLST